MSEITQSESTIQRCAECGGLWVDVADLNKMLLHAGLPAATATGGQVNPDEMAGMCPACNVDLVAVEGGVRRSLHYDTCESCGGIWVPGLDDVEVPESATWTAAVDEIVGFFRDFGKR
jgi:Zn-finger nucleic acid-binding protein